MPHYLKLGIAVVCLIAVASGLFVARSRLTATPVPAVPQPVPVTAAEVARQDVPIVLEGLGTVQALYTATMRTQVTGTLEEVDFTEGLKVKRGQVLAQIDPRTFQAALDQAIATRDRDQAQLDSEVQVAAYTADDKIELDRGRLLLIDNQADPTSGPVRLKAIFPNSAGKLWPGLRSSGARRSDGLVGRP